MKKDDQKPETKPAGAMPPPRPPRNTAIGLGPDEDDDSGKIRRKKETVTIYLPPKPSATLTIKLPAGSSGTTSGTK